MRLLMGWSGVRSCVPRLSQDNTLAWHVRVMGSWANRRESAGWTSTGVPTAIFWTYWEGRGAWPRISQHGRWVAKGQALQLACELASWFPHLWAEWLRSAFHQFLFPHLCKGYMQVPQNSFCVPEVRSYREIDSQEPGWHESPVKPFLLSANFRGKCFA